MAEYEQLFAMLLQQKLKNKIIGKIYVKVTGGDCLYVQITNSDNVDYKLHIDNFSEKMVNGYSTDYAAYEIIAKYRKFVNEYVMNRYFYND